MEVRSAGSEDTPAAWHPVEEQPPAGAGHGVGAGRLRHRCHRPRVVTALPISVAFSRWYNSTIAAER